MSIRNISNPKGSLFEKEGSCVVFYSPGKREVRSTYVSQDEKPIKISGEDFYLVDTLDMNTIENEEDLKIITFFKSTFRIVEIKKQIENIQASSKILSSIFTNEILE